MWSRGLCCPIELKRRLESLGRGLSLDRGLVASSDLKTRLEAPGPSASNRYCSSAFFTLHLSVLSHAMSRSNAPFHHAWSTGVPLMLNPGLRFHWRQGEALISAVRKARSGYAARGVFVFSDVLNSRTPNSLKPGAVYVYPRSCSEPDGTMVEKRPCVCLFDTGRTPA